MNTCDIRYCEKGLFSVNLAANKGEKIGYGKRDRKAMYHGASQRARWK